MVLTMVKIQFFYYEDCPSHDTALERLHSIMDELEISAPVEVTRVETEEQAQTLEFIGSPTIRINGQDIDTVPDDIPYSLTCRAYRRDDGRISPLPPVSRIREALLTSLTQSSYQQEV